MTAIRQWHEILYPSPTTVDVLFLELFSSCDLSHDVEVIGRKQEEVIVRKFTPFSNVKLYTTYIHQISIRNVRIVFASLRLV